MKVNVKLALHGEYYGYVCFQGLYESAEKAINETIRKYEGMPEVKVLTYVHDHSHMKYDNDNTKHTHVMVYNSKYNVISQAEFESACEQCSEEQFDYWDMYTIEEMEIQ
jgi:hypothetical protein